MRVLVIGCGSIGMRHLRNLKSLGGMELLAYDPILNNRERAHRECDAYSFDSMEVALRAGADIAFVTTPSHLHVPIALQAARAGCHLFIEKPLSHTEEGLDALVELVRAKGLITMVGCNMRFHQGPVTMKQLLESGVIGKITSAIMEAGYYMPDWHADKDYRARYSANRSMGGGVILDAIHEIDYAQWLFGEAIEVFCAGGKISSLDIDVEDSVNVIMQFASGLSIMLHLDYIQRTYARSCKIIGEEGTISWDIAGPFRWFSAKTKTWTTIDPPPEYTINDMYIEELRHFLDCYAHRKRTTLDVEDGARVTRLALAIKQSMNTRQKVTL